LKANLAAQQDVDAAETAAATAKADIDVQKASLEQAKAQLQQAKVNLSYTSIYSPIDGTVISRNVDVGQTVASSMTAPVLFTIAEDLRRMQVNTNVAEGDVGRLASGQDTTFTVDAFPGDKFKGRISQIRNAATTVSNVVTYDAVIDVDNPDLRLRPGMTANVTVVYADEKNVIAVPNTALRFKPPVDVAVPSASAPPEAPAAPTEIASASASASAPASASASASAPASEPAPAPAGSGRRGTRGGGAPASPTDPRPIYLLRDGAPLAVIVKPGLSDGTYTEIVSGDLKEGDDVIVDATVEGASAVPAAASSKPRSSGAPRMF
jgi:HlyD family secretion protein